MFILQCVSVFTLSFFFSRFKNHVGPAETSSHSSPLLASSRHAVAQLWGPPWSWKQLRQSNWRRPQPGMGWSVLQTSTGSEQWPQCRKSSWGSCCRSNRRSYDWLCTEPTWVWLRVRWRLWGIRGLWGIWRIWGRVWLPTIWRWLWSKGRLWAWGFWRSGVLHWSFQRPHLQQHHRRHRLLDVPAPGPLGGCHVELEIPKTDPCSKITHNRKEDNIRIRNFLIH